MVSKIEMMETKTFKLNKWRLLLILLVSVIFIMNGLAILFEGKTEIVSTNPILVKTVGFLTLLFFSLIIFIVSKRLFEPELGLTIDEEGVNDHSSNFAVGLVKWENVTQIETKKFIWMKSLLIHTNNPEEYLREASGFKLRLLAGNIHRSKTPIVISGGGLKIKFSKLEELIQDYWEKSKTQIR
jgi:hypothetical protein